MRISDWSSDLCSSDLWFIDLSHRRGRSILQERHERGAMLVDRALLRAEILEHNQARYDEDVHEHCPGHSPAAGLRMPFRARQEAGIPHIGRASLREKGWP